MEYTSEPTVVTDEWELDPSLLQFSTPLGQGAFGKVVTGYYAQRKVAIKVVKGQFSLEAVYCRYSLNRLFCPLCAYIF